MAKLRLIVKEPNQVLRGEARPVPVKGITSLKIKRLIADMKETLKNTPDGVGLAASQAGEPLQIFIVSEEAEEVDEARRQIKKGYELPGKKEDEDEKSKSERNWKYYVFINPEVKKIARKKLEDAEGCLSVPGRFGTVKRAEKITATAYDETGKKFTRGASGFFARVMQHELDHLKGTLFIDKAEKFLE